MTNDKPIQRKGELIYIHPNGTIEYNYRATDGELFQSITATIEEAREACAKWILSK